MEDNQKNVDLRYSVDGVLLNYYVMPEFIHIGRVQTKERWGYWEHRHDSYECIYVNKGAVNYWCNSVKKTAMAGDFYYIQPGQTHREESEQEELDFYYLKFYYLDIKGNSYYFIPPPGDPGHQIIRGIDADFKMFMESIYEEILHQQAGSKQIIEAKILEMTWLLRRILKIQIMEYVGIQEDRRSDIVNSAISYIENNYHRKLMLSEIAEKCNISSDYLSHIFKEITDFSPLQYAEHIRIEESKKLIIDSSYSLSEIAQRVGLCDEFYFSKKFKKIVGVPPREYKKLNTNVNSFNKTKL